jgi:hypothetical protein
MGKGRVERTNKKKLKRQSEKAFSKGGGEGRNG